MIFEFLEKNVKDFDRKTFAVLLMQFLLIAMAALLFFRSYIDGMIFISVEVAFLLVYAELLFIELGKVQKDGFWKYVLFFAGVAILLQLVCVAEFLNIGESSVQRLVFVLGAFIVFAVAFRLFFGRNYTQGKVLTADGKIAVVETEFDLLSFTSTGKYI